MEDLPGSKVFGTAVGLGITLLAGTAIGAHLAPVRICRWPYFPLMPMSRRRA